MKNSALLLLFLAIINLEGCYLLKQGAGQLELRLSQIPLGKAISEEKNAEHKALLKTVPAVKQYAESVLLLKKTDNYTSYYKTDKRGVSFIVTAAPKTSLKPYTWWFPVIGSVPYKGFFNEEDALKLQKELTQKGFDTYLWAASAYSTLGWFNDPITTPMLKKGRFNLASTVIHEMVHTTKYINGQGDFNEQLASFVEVKGAIAFFKDNNLLTKDQLNRIEISRKRNAEVTKLIQSYLGKLEEVYSREIQKSQMLDEREQIFESLTGELIKKNPQRKREYWIFNNARLLQYKRYQEDPLYLNEIWKKSQGNWGQFWQLVNKYTQDQGWE